jgi:hypothetical protein
VWQDWKWRQRSWDRRYQEQGKSWNRRAAWLCEGVSWLHPVVTCVRLAREQTVGQKLSNLSGGESQNSGAQGAWVSP